MEGQWFSNYFFQLLSSLKSKFIRVTVEIKTNQESSFISCQICKLLQMKDHCSGIESKIFLHPISSMCFLGENMTRQSTQVFMKEKMFYEGKKENFVYVHELLPYFVMTSSSDFCGRTANNDCICQSLINTVGIAHNVFGMWLRELADILDHSLGKKWN